MNNWTWNVTLCLSVSGVLAVPVFGGADQGPASVADNTADNKPEIPPEYELIRSDAAWCGPRILYFFSVYMGRDRPLKEVLGLCRADSSGYVSLESVVQAATLMGLEPIAMNCSPEEIIRTGGPAMIVINKESSHFLGLLTCNGETCTVVDPSRPSSVIEIPIIELEKDLTGHVVFLKGARIPQNDFSVAERIAIVAGAVSAVILLGIGLRAVIPRRTPGRIE